MNLNDFYYISASLTIFCMLLFFVCFFLFAYLKSGRVSLGKDTFLFFDFMLFKSSLPSNLSAISIAGALIFGNLFDYIRNQNASTLYVNSIGFISTLVFFVHCRFFSAIKYNENHIKCIKEFFLNANLSPKYSFLWLSRASYVMLIVFTLVD